MEYRLMLYCPILMFVIGCAETCKKSEPIVLHDGTVVEYTKMERTNFFGQDAIIVDRFITPAKTGKTELTGSLGNTDQGAGKSMMPAAIISGGNVGAAAAHRPDKFEYRNSVTQLGGGSTVGPIAGGSSTAETGPVTSTGGASAAHADATQNQAQSAHSEQSQGQGQQQDQASQNPSENRHRTRHPGYGEYVPN